MMRALHTRLIFEITVSCIYQIFSVQLVIWVEEAVYLNGRYTEL